MVRRFTFIGLLGALVLFGACSGDRHQGVTDPPLDTRPHYKLTANPFTLQFGDTATVTSEDVQVVFSSVLQDSRCPSDVVCFWEGEVVIELLVIDLAEPDTHVVTLSLRGFNPPNGGPYPPSVDEWGFRFTLMNVDPYPISTDPIADSEYVATLSVFRHETQVTPDGEVIISDSTPQQIMQNAFALKSVRVRGDEITLKLQYSGGCEAHEFRLYMSPSSFAASRPAEANLYLHHNANGDACEALITDTATFDLRPLAYLHQMNYGYLECMILNVYRYSMDEEPVDYVSVIYNPKGSRHVVAVCRDVAPVSVDISDSP